MFFFQIIIYLLDGIISWMKEENNYNYKAIFILLSALLIVYDGIILFSFLY